MNFTRLKLRATAGLAFAVAGGLLAVGLGLFLFCWLKSWFEPAVAAGISFIVFAVLAAVVGLIQGARAREGSSHPQASPSGGLPERALDLARRRPIIALGIGAIGVIIALRNPALLATLAGAALSRPPSRR